MMRWLLMAILLSLTATARGDWVTVPPVRQSGMGGSLGEIEDRMPGQHQYRASDVGTWAHETTHGLNSRIRQQAGGTGQVNAFYLLGGKAMVLPEPRGVTLSKVAARIPANQRGSAYQLYFVEQQRYWQNEPLYLCDELACYLNGAAVRYEYGLDVRSDLLHARELYLGCLVLLDLCRESGYSHDRELTEYLIVCCRWWQALAAAAGGQQ